MRAVLSRCRSRLFSGRRLQQALTSAVAVKDLAIEEGGTVRRSKIVLVGMAKRIGPATPATELADKSSAVKSHVGMNACAGAASGSRRGSVATQVAGLTVLEAAQRGRGSISLAAP